MSSARRTVHELLAAARARTLELIAPLDEAQLTTQHSPLMSPIVWDLGHIANYEEQWSIRALDPSAPVLEDVDWIYDPMRNPRATRKDLPLPRSEVNTGRLLNPHDSASDGERGRTPRPAAAGRGRPGLCRAG